jgi:hypothetical protein
VLLRRYSRAGRPIFPPFLFFSRGGAPAPDPGPRPTPTGAPWALPNREPGEGSRCQETIERAFHDRIASGSRTERAPRTRPALRAPVGKLSGRRVTRAGYPERAAATAREAIAAVPGRVGLIGHPLPPGQQCGPSPGCRPGAARAGSARRPPRRPGRERRADALNQDAAADRHEPQRPHFRFGRGFLSFTSILSGARGPDGADARTIATIPARTASGRRSQASMTRVRSGSGGRGFPCVASATEAVALAVAPGARNFADSRGSLRNPGPEVSGSG